MLDLDVTTNKHICLDDLRHVCVCVLVIENVCTYVCVHGVCVCVCDCIFEYVFRCAI